MWEELINRATQATKAAITWEKTATNGADQMKNAMSFASAHQLRMLLSTIRPSSRTYMYEKIRDSNEPESRLASPSHTVNLSGLVLGCIEADLCK